MKRLLIPSLCLNVLLVALVGSLFSTRQPSLNPAPDPAPTPSGRERQAGPPPVPSPAGKAFAWSQLDADDYPTFIARLRAIGCPEPTIRSIITGEVAAFYDQKRKALQADGGRAGANAEAVREQTAALWSEQNDLIARLLPTAAGTASTTGVGRNSGPTGSSPASRDPSAPARPVALPAALLDPPPGISWNERQLADLEELRRDFVEAVGGPDQDPTDPGYRERWEKAKPQSDAQFKLVFGAQALSLLETLASEQDQPPSPPP